MYVPQLNNQRQMPVRLSSVNFDGVFTSSRLNMENLISQNNLYSNQPAPNQPNRSTNAYSKGTPGQGGNRK